MIRQVNPAEFIPQIGELLAQHWSETGSDFDLQPNVELYDDAHMSGRLLTLGAFDGDSMVGYATGVLSPHLYNPHVTMCACDALFVMPDHRRGLTPGRLIKAMEALAAERGATHVLWMTHGRTDLHEMFAAHDYAVADISMMRRLQ